MKIIIFEVKNFERKKEFFSKKKFWEKMFSKEKLKGKIFGKLEFSKFDFKGKF